jgi:hypothetical protein
MWRGLRWSFAPLVQRVVQSLVQSSEPLVQWSVQFVVQDRTVDMVAWQSAASTHFRFDVHRHR